MCGMGIYMELNAKQTECILLLQCVLDVQIDMYYKHIYFTLV
jgi:hypothetical protein